MKNPKKMKKARNFSINIRNPNLVVSEKTVLGRGNPENIPAQEPKVDKVLSFSFFPIFQKSNKTNIILEKRIGTYVEIELREEKSKKPGNSFPELFALQIRVVDFDDDD
jgi:hypothetical protein